MVVINPTLLVLKSLAGIVWKASLSHHSMHFTLTWREISAITINSIMFVSPQQQLLCAGNSQRSKADDSLPFYIFVVLTCEVAILRQFAPLVVM